MYREVKVGDRVRFYRMGSLVSADVEEVFSHVILCRDHKGKTYTPSRIEVSLENN